MPNGQGLVTPGVPDRAHRSGDPYSSRPGSGCYKGIGKGF